MSEVRFAVVVDGEVAGTFSFDDNNSDSVTSRMIPALRSNPVVVEDQSLTVKHGWQYDGTTFVNPEA